MLEMPAAFFDLLRVHGGDAAKQVAGECVVQRNHEADDGGSLGRGAAIGESRR